ncbi:Fanconi anemia group A protein [Heteronotia binoei]|uniref:Fanconi anemia group A protein n=1 Tax=Heteronotia binoei TaxID=13085 RepID=UPI00292F1875|nr:Fanconi anemia group A protein [Heteronotia binoei]
MCRGPRGKEERERSAPLKDYLAGPDPLAPSPASSFLAVGCRGLSGDLTSLSEKANCSLILAAALNKWGLHSWTFSLSQSKETTADPKCSIVPSSPAASWAVSGAPEKEEYLLWVTNKPTLSAAAASLQKGQTHPEPADRAKGRLAGCPGKRHNQDGARCLPSPALPPLSLWPPPRLPVGRATANGSAARASPERWREGGPFPRSWPGQVGRRSRLLPGKRGSLEASSSSAPLEQARLLREEAGGRRVAERAKKQACGPRNAQELQEAALRLLNCHQNLSELLLEVGSSEGDKPLYSCGSCIGGHEDSAPESFAVPALQEEASMLGVPLGVLSARTAAANIEKISGESGEAVLLNAEQREKLSCLLQTLKVLLACNAFCRLLFAQALWRMQSPLALELAWHLHRGGILSLEELLENHPDASALVDWLCSSLRLLCHQAEESSMDTETLQGILTDFGIVFLHNGFRNKSEMGRKLESQPVPSEICCAVLERMLAWVLDTAAKEKQEDASTLRAVNCWLGMFSLTASQGTVPSESLRQFFSHTFTHVLTYNPQIKVSEAISRQREWSFARNGSLLTTLYQKLFVVLAAKELIGHLQQVLEANEVNWHHVLSSVSTLLVCRAEAEQLVKDLLSRLLRKGFENYDVESLITAFLIARQAALEGPALFMPYSEWFKLAFGSAGGFHGSSKKAVVFLFKFLSELVPFEAPQYLKVHIMHPPFVPAKYRPFLLEYITLAKTRLADFKVAIEDMGLYEDLSSPKDALQPHRQALQDVEKAVQIFENTGKIPAVVLEASVFRRPYYVSRFLPALLVPRLLPETLDPHMALIDALKRAEKIPPNTYSKFIEECQSVKEKFLRGGCPGAKIAGDLRGPLEPLKAALEALKRLVTDQSMQDALPAQVAVISEKLAAVLGHRKDEDDAASLSLRIKLNLSVPEVQQQDQEVVDLLLTAFCQTVMAASYFSPPDGQGVWPALFVKMVCGHRRLLPSLLSRLCQLIRHQGPSLSNAHIIGLAVFVVHFNEAKSLIPEVDVYSWVPHGVTARGLPVAELWDHLLPCRTGESIVFCLRFCTAAVSYFLCKFSSFSHEFLCASLYPGFIKKLQYVVPRLSIEARGTGCGGDEAEFPWKSLFRSAVCCQQAVRCLWKQTRFKKLLQEKMFQLTLQEWLLMELEIDPGEDALSASERQEFHYWALYQHYLPASAASGGCEGDLREMCSVLIGSVLDFCQRSELSNCSHSEKPKRSIPRLRGNPEIHCRLQEMLLEVELERRRAPSGGHGDDRHFLFRTLQERLKALGPDSAESGRLLRQQELILQRRILLGLPPSLLITTQQKGKEIALDCEDFFGFVNTELKNVCSRGYALSYDITAHFFRGLLSASLECNRSAQEVTAVLVSCQARCPVLLCSAARWWCKLEPVLCCEWQRLFTVPLAQGLQRLKELQRSVNSFLSSEASSLASDVPWISAAFLHFAIQQQTECEKADALKRLGPGSAQILVCLLFFSVVDFISARLAPQEGMDAPRTLDWSSQIARLLEERGSGWLALFLSGETEHSLDPVLHSAVSDQHRKQLPVAFYSLLFTLHPERLLREQLFLSVAVDMYLQLLRLFMEGTAVVEADQAECPVHGQEPEDPLAVIHAARRFLVQAIPQCPPGSFSHLHQLLDLCGELDPELKATLTSRWQPPAEESLSDEELLLF